MKIPMPTLCIVLSVFIVNPQQGKAENQEFVPFFALNSIDRKVLNVRYSFFYESFEEKKKSGKRDVHLVFDADSEKFREETKWYDNPNDTNTYLLVVDMWDGKEAVSWTRPVTQIVGFRSLGAGLYESPGSATIRTQTISKIPYFLSIYYDALFRPLAKMALLQKPKYIESADNRIVLETKPNRFEFSKRTGALEKLVFFCPCMETGKLVKREMYELSHHVEMSGVWVPLEIKTTKWNMDEKLTSTGMLLVDRKTLRLYTKPEDDIFHITLPPGCLVSDQLRKKDYTVTTLSINPPQDVEALQKMLDSMIDQAEEQKAAMEREEEQKQEHDEKTK